MKTPDGTNNVNIEAPFYTPSQNTFDFWVGYERKLTDDINWRIQLNVYNVFGENELIPFSASVDYAALRNPDGTFGDITPTTVIPMKASAFTIREGMSWQITNTFSF